MLYEVRRSDESAHLLPEEADFLVAEPGIAPVDPSPGGIDGGTLFG